VKRKLDAQKLTGAAGEHTVGGIGSRPLCQHAMEQWRRRQRAAEVGCRRSDRLAVRRVELAVRGEIRVERERCEARAQTRRVDELRVRGREVEVRYSPYRL
jgi:hypothetical protein